MPPFCQTYKLHSYSILSIIRLFVKAHLTCTPHQIQQVFAPFFMLKIVWLGCSKEVCRQIYAAGVFQYIYKSNISYSEPPTRCIASENHSDHLDCEIKQVGPDKIDRTDVFVLRVDVELSASFLLQTQATFCRP
jgi:hypothetical protein